MPAIRPSCASSRTICCERYPDRISAPRRRQDFAFDVYKTNGAIYLARRDVLMEEGSFYGSHPRPLVMPPERSIDIDTELDFEMAEFLFQRRAKATI